MVYNFPRSLRAIENFIFCPIIYPTNIANKFRFGVGFKYPYFLTIL